MWANLALIGLLLALSSTRAQNFTCPGAQTLQDTLGFPTCADSMDPDYDVCDEPVLPNNKCSFSLFSNDSTAYGAQLTIYATNLGQNDTIVIDGLKDLITIPRYTGNSVVRAVFPFSGDPKRPFATVTIVASDTSSLTFGYYVQKTKLPAAKNPSQLSVGAGKLAQFINLKTAQPGDSWEIAADQQIALSAAAKEAITDPLGPLANNFLNIWMYEGTGENKTHVGSLYSALSQPLTSTGATVTLLYMLEPLNNTFEGTIVANENSNLVDCSTYTVEYASDSILSKQLFNTGNYACYTVLTDPDDTQPFYLSGLSDGDDDSQLDNTIYLLAGGPLPLQNVTSSASSLAVYSKSSPFTTPQLIPGYARTFVSASFRLWLFFSRDVNSADATDPAFGRNGFIMTSNYPYSMPNQQAALTLYYTYPFNFTFTVLNSFSTDAMLTIQGSKVTIYKERISQIVHKTISVVDSTIQLTIDQDSGTDGGAYLTYQVIRDANEPLSCPDSIYLPGSAQSQQPFSGILPSNFACNFTFVVAEGTWYTMIDSLQVENMAPGEYAEVRSDFNTVRSTENSTYFTMINTTFPGQTVTIFVSTGGSTQMTLQYNLHAPTWPEMFPQAINLTQYDDAYYLQFKTVSDITTWQINYDSPMVLVSALSTFYSPFMLLNFFVYEGAGDDKQLVGTLYGTDVQSWSSKSNTTTIFFAQPSNILFEGALVVSPSKNLEGCKYYSALWSDYEFAHNPYIYENHVSIDATQGSSCLVIVNDYDESNFTSKDIPILFGYKTYKGLIVNSTSPFIIAGAPMPHARNSSQRILANFSPGDPNYFDIPQVFDGRSRTVYVPFGTLDFLMTANPSMAPAENVAGSRVGFISTNNYPFSSTEQEGSAALLISSSSTAPYLFNFTIRQPFSPAADAVMGIVSAFLNFTVDLTDTVAAGKTYTVPASWVNIYLNGGNGPNTGVYVSYTATATSVTGTSTTVTGTSTTVTTQGPTNGGNSKTVATTTTSPTVSPTTPKAAITPGGLVALITVFFSFFF